MSSDPDPSLPPEPEGGVPPLLHSVESQAPFARCVDCGTELQRDDVMHSVEKVVRDGEVVFEYALCAACGQKLIREYSEESLRTLLEYLDETPDLIATGPEAPDHCHRCGRGGDAFFKEHTVMGLLQGSRLLMGPSTLCAACTEGIEDLLSEKTREVHGDFVARTFPGVPEGIDLPVGMFGA